MKTKNSILKLSMLLCFVIVGSMEGWAGGSTYYYYKATVNTNGNGIVYISETDNKGSKQEIAPTNNEKKYPGFYLFAEPDDGYVFTGWKKGATLISKHPECYQIEYVSSTDKGNPSSFSYTAYFEKIGQLKVESENLKKGTVSLDKYNNSIGDVVKLTATPRFGYIFNGWSVEGSDNTISDNPLNVTVERAITYTAQWKPYSYCRIRSASNHDICFVGNRAEANQPTINNSKRTNVLFRGSAQLIDATNAADNPGTILMISANEEKDKWKDFDASAQDLKLSTAFKQAAGGTTQTVEVSLNDNDGKSFQFFNRQKDSRRYLKDGTALYALNKGHNEIIKGWCYIEGYDEACYNWYLEPVIEETVETSYFGVTPTLQVGDKYYTTLYVTFPFECYEPDGVKAYYVDKIENGVANCVEITSGKVHSKTPVILECNGSTAKQNRLIPLAEEPSAINGNILQGALNLYKSSATEITKDPSSVSGKLILNQQGENAVVFSSDNISDMIASNTAYLESSSDVVLSIFNKSVLELNEASTSIDEINGKFSDVTVTRTIKADKWNTFCMPFAMEKSELGEDVEVKQLSAFSVNEEASILNMTFTDATAIEAGHPYMVRMKNGIEKLTLTSKAVNTTEAPAVSLENEKYTLTFHGNYTKMDAVPEGSFIISDNKFYYVNSVVALKGFRGYFTVEPKEGNPAIKALNFGFDEAATGVNTLELIPVDNGNIFNLQGQRINKLQRGINIVNGHKVIR